MSATPLDGWFDEIARASSASRELSRRGHLVTAYGFARSASVITWLVGVSGWLTYKSGIRGPRRLEMSSDARNDKAPGYQVAFNIFLRGTMTVFGLAFSMAVFGAMAWFLSITFVPAARAAGDGHTVGLIGIIVMLVIATYLNFQIALRSFSLITSLPDRISRWWGAAGENLGEENDTSKAIAFMTHQVSNRMEGELKMGGMSNGGGGKKKAPEEKAPEGKEGKGTGS